MQSGGVCGYVKAVKRRVADIQAESPAAPGAGTTTARAPWTGENEGAQGVIPPQAGHLLAERNLTPISISTNLPDAFSPELGWA